MTRGAHFPQLGDELQCRLVDQRSSNEWSVSCFLIETAWTARLTSRTGKLYTEGDEAEFWVHGLDPRQQLVLVSDSDFGRLPISDRMRPRYLLALRSVLRSTSPQELASVHPSDLSEAKGMFNRCIRKDQWDWLTVYSALGRPDIQFLRRATDAVGLLASALRRNDGALRDASVEAVKRLELAIMVERAYQRIESSAPRLGAVLEFQPIPSGPNEEERRDEDLADDSYILSQVARVKLDRANRVHRQTLQNLAEFLYEHGHLVQRSKLIDAFCHLKSGPAIFEIKSITPENERSQCREALSQLYEYRYLHSLPGATLWLVLSERPRLRWLVDYLRADREIGVLWMEEGRLGGPSFGSLLDGGG